MLGRSGGFAQDAGDDHVELGLPLQHLVLRHRDDIVDSDDVEELEQFGRREATIEAHEDAGSREAFLQPADDALEQRQCTRLGGDVARAQRRGAQVLLVLAVEGQERQQRQVAPGVVEAIEERHLLGAVRGIVGDVEIDGDPAHLAATLAVPLQHAFEQRLAHRQQLAARDVVLEPRQRRLRRQRLARERIAPQQQLVHGIVGEPRCVVGVVVSERQAVDALAEQVAQAVAHLARLPLIDERGGESRDQAEPPIRGLEQHRAAIGAGVGDVESNRQRPVEQLREQHTRCRGKVAHAKASFRGESTLNKRFLPRGGLRATYDS